MGVAIILALAALITSIISGILGMAGGMLLLAVMLSFLSHGDAIPTHAAVQIASNGTRVLAFIRNVDRRAFGQFCLGVIPGGAIGTFLLWALGQPQESDPYLKMLVGIFVIATTLWPRNGKAAESANASWWGFPAIGLLAGTAALTVGAIGPLIAPIFARRNFVKERLIATKATCQLLTHVMKIPAFLLVRDLELDRLGGLALVMIVMVIPGTLIGKRILKSVSPRHFAVAFRVAIIAAGLKVLLIDGVYRVAYPS